LFKIDKWLSAQLKYPAYNINNTNNKSFNFSEYSHEKILISIKSNKEIKKALLKKNKIKLIEKNITFFKISKKKKLEDNYFKNIRLVNSLDKKKILDIAENSFIVDFSKIKTLKEN
jgi:hypothetical protein